MPCPTYILRSPIDPRSSNGISLTSWSDMSAFFHKFMIHATSICDQTRREGSHLPVTTPQSLPLSYPERQDGHWLCKTLETRTPFLALPTVTQLFRRTQASEPVQSKERAYLQPCKRHASQECFAGSGTRVSAQQ